MQREVDMTRIFLAEDHDIVRRGLCALLEEQPGWTVCGEASNGMEAVDAIIAQAPNVAIVDYALPMLNGLEVIRKVHRAAADIQTLMFTQHDNEVLIKEALQAGARGFLTKSDSDDQIVSAVSALSRRRPYFSMRLSEAMLKDFLRQGEGPENPLSPREREVVQLIAEGNSNKRVASLLDISIKTVESHRSASMRKLNIKTTANLIRYAVRNRLIEA
jgi:DNA-binding NarL/FixJ family response regulator